MAYFNMAHLLAYGKNKIQGITADDVRNAFAKAGDRAKAAQLLKIKYKTLCSWLTSKASYYDAMIEGLKDYKQDGKIKT